MAENANEQLKRTFLLTSLLVECRRHETKVNSCNIGKKESKTDDSPFGRYLRFVKNIWKKKRAQLSCFPPKSVSAFQFLYRLYDQVQVCIGIIQVQKTGFGNYWTKFKPYLGKLQKTS